VSALHEVGLPRLDNFSVQVVPPATVQLVGVIAVQDPARILGTFFAAVHRAITSDRLAEITVDVRHLTFVNSSAIRLFVDWATWARGPQNGYVIRFRTDRRITWQRTSFSVLQSLAPSTIRVDSE